MRQINTLTGFLLSKSSNPSVNDTVEFQGYTAIGDGGAATWQHNGVTAQPVSQSPAQLGGALLNDGSGNQWALIVEGEITSLMLGAVSDNGVTDSTLAVQASHNSGLLLTENGNTYGISSLTAKSSVVGGKYLRLSGSGNFITTGANNLSLSMEVDCQFIGDKGLSIENDGTITTDEFSMSNTTGNGVDARNVNNVTINGTITDSKNAHVQIVANTQDMLNLKIDCTVNGLGVGLLNTNGGVKVHGSASFAVVSPVITANVTLIESLSVPVNAVCIETLTNVKSPIVNGIAYGGNIGCTLNGSPKASALVVAYGQAKIGLEITNGSHGAKFIAGSSSSIGDGGVAPINSCQCDNSDDALFDVVASDPDGSVDTSSAIIYITESQNAEVRGSISRTGALNLIRLRASSGFRMNNLKASGVATQRALIVDATLGSCDNIRASNATFDGVINFMRSTDTLNGFFASSTSINNTGALFSGAPTLSNYRFDITSDILTHSFGATLDFYSIPSLSSSGGESIIDGYGTGTPELFISANVGSKFNRTDGGASTTLYIKESGAGTSGWVAK